jgi:hypothetical protein
MNWTDGTGYSQNDKVRTPTVLRGKINALEIIVHRIHGIPDTWYLTCRYLDIKERQLDSADLESCERQSIAIIKDALCEKIQEMQSIFADVLEVDKR